MARRRGIRNATFEKFDLNEVAERGTPRRHEVVTCFETLEHVGNPRNALRNLRRACRPGGWLLITVPNESGFVGLVKFLGRRLARPRRYEAFFEQGGKERQYLWALIRGRSIAPFRATQRALWEEHLGFDLAVFEDTLRDELIHQGPFALRKRRSVNHGLGRLYVMQDTSHSSSGSSSETRRS